MKIELKIINFYQKWPSFINMFFIRQKQFRQGIRYKVIQMNSKTVIELPQQQVKLGEQSTKVIEEVNEQGHIVPLKLLKEHWLTISRPQYKRTCGISSVISIWNHQFSRLGLGTRDPICVEQAMLKLNLIGKGSIQENMRKKFKKAGELTEKSENSIAGNENNGSSDSDFNDKSLHQYIDSVDFGCFTGNDTLLKWYRLLCRIYGGSGRSYYFYKTNSQKSMHKNEKNAKKGIVQGLNKENTCFIYHAYDHYFCPLGYQFVPKEETQSQTFETTQLSEQGSELYIMVGESSKMFPGIHVFKWSQIQLDLETYWPKFFNIRRRKEGVQTRAGKENDIPGTSTINCIMAFEKIKD